MFIYYFLLFWPLPLCASGDITCFLGDCHFKKKQTKKTHKPTGRKAQRAVSPRRAARSNLICATKWWKDFMKSHARRWPWQHGAVLSVILCESAKRDAVERKHSLEVCNPSTIIENKQHTSDQNRWRIKNAVPEGFSSDLRDFKHLKLVSKLHWNGGEKNKNTLYFFTSLPSHTSK